MFITPDKMDGKRISYDYVVQQYEIQRLLQGRPIITLIDICKEITSGIRVKKEYYTDKNGYKIIAPGVFFASQNSSLLQNFFPRHRWGIFMLTPIVLTD